MTYLQTIYESHESITRLPKHVVNGIVRSTELHPEIVGNYDKPELHLAQSVNQVVWAKDALRVPIPKKSIIRSFLARRIEHFWSEATAYIGMGVTHLSTELEDYYAHIFKDRRSTAEQAGPANERLDAGIAVESGIKNWRQQLRESRAKMKAIATETPGQTSYENYHLAAARVVAQCQNLLALRQQLAVDPAQETGSTTGPEAQMRYLDNMAQCALHQALNYLCDINPEHPPSVLPAAA